MNQTYARIALIFPVGFAVGAAAYQTGYVTAGLAAPPLADQGAITWPRLILAVLVAAGTSLALTWSWGLKRRPSLLPLTAAASALISASAIAALALTRLSGSAHVAALVLATLGFLVGVGTATPWRLVVGGGAASTGQLPAIPPESYRRPRAEDVPAAPRPAAPATLPSAAPQAVVPPPPGAVSPPTLETRFPSAPQAARQQSRQQEPRRTAGPELGRPAATPANATITGTRSQPIPTTSHPVHDEITRIAERLARRIAPLLLTRLRERYGDAWTEEVAARRRSPRHANKDCLRDYRYCLAVFGNDRATKGWIPERYRRNARRLVQLAHQAAHRSPLTIADQEHARALADDISEALQALGTGGAVDSAGTASSPRTVAGTSRASSAARPGQPHRRTTHAAHVTTGDQPADQCGPG